MNYYPFHIGDFAAHTAHLTWEEDIAYRRMLDWYYLNEKSLPADAQKVARLVRMPKSLSVIEAVLSEFFILSDDGWHNKRADEELTSMLTKKEQQSTKDEHEADRMRRHRERRAQVFAALRAVEIVPAWDVPMKELQRLFDQHCNAPATDLQREQGVSGNADATAIPTPTPTPTPEEKNPSGSAAPAKPSRKPAGSKRVPADFLVTPDMEAWASTDAPLIDWRRETDKFRDWEFKTPRTDWAATWRTWMRKAQEGAIERGKAQPSPVMAGVI